MGSVAGDTVNWVGLLALAALALGFAVLLGFVVIKADRINIKALEALGRRRGWKVTRVPASLGRGARVRVVPQGRAQWSCEVTRQSQSQTKSPVRTTEFEATVGLIARGLVVIGPALPDEAADTSEKMLSLMGGRLEQIWLQRLLGEDVAVEIAGLRRLPAKSAEVTVFATAEVALEPEFVRLTEAWRRSHSAERDFPILIATAERTRLRLRRDLFEPAELEQFIDMGLQFHTKADWG